MEGEPGACTVMTSEATENSVRWSGLRSLLFKWHWLKALPAATSIVSCGPSSSSDAKSTAYDTDIVEPLVVSGRCTFNAAVIDESTSRPMNSTGCANVASRQTQTSSVSADRDDRGDVDARRACQLASSMNPRAVDTQWSPQSSFSSDQST